MANVKILSGAVHWNSLAVARRNILRLSQFSQHEIAVTVIQEHIVKTV